MATEVTTHHVLNPEALKTWIYPTNLGPVRDYQFSIAKNGLFNNTLVALPTGLGKTFIAATVMLNFFRWTKSSKIIFVAPTKPLVAQQIDACLNIAGIPRSQTTRLDGDVNPAIREQEWASKRLFFMTPQTLANDLSKGYADPKSIVLLVIDEAHRATGNYSYVKVIEFMRRFSQSFRVLALTATPGSTVEAVQGVIDNLGISHVEIRTEESLDIRQYVHSRSIDTVLLDPSDEMLHVRELFSKALKPLVDKLSSQNIYWGRDPMNLTTFGLLKLRDDWMKSRGHHVNQGLKQMMRAVFALLQSLAHAIKLLNFHGIKPFYDNLATFRAETEAQGAKGPKYRRQLLEDPNFTKMMDMIERWQKLGGFVGHPKLTYLCDTLLNHFMDAGQGSSTRAIVFSEYRDSGLEVVRVLNAHKPLVSATLFVGQSDSKRTEGMSQKQQIETIEKFKAGVYNVLVATSIGEEGLDIGQVDLIVCYDASGSPIRMLQRMGRTGRKRNGNIVLLLMKGKEEEQFAKAKDNYEQIQKLISEGSRFDFRYDLSSRIVPRDIQPQVDKRMVEIPIENSQKTSLIAPKKKKAASSRAKASKKKFHMPDGVETGFMKASLFAGVPSKTKKPQWQETDELAEIPDVSGVMLSTAETRELDWAYRELPFQNSPLEEVSQPDLRLHPTAQRVLRPTVNVRHGRFTKRCVKVFSKMGRPDTCMESFYGDYDEDDWKKLSVLPFDDINEAGTRPATNTRSLKRLREDVLSEDESLVETEEPSKRRVVAAKRVSKGGKRAVPSIFMDDCEDGDEDSEDIDAAMDEDEPKATRGRQTSSRGRKRGRVSQARSKLKRVGDHLEELGDDCERTSDIEETDGSDSGADLLDFIVGDDDITSSMMRSHLSTSPTTCSSPRLDTSQAKERRRKKPGIGRRGSDEAERSTIIIPTQDSSEDSSDFDKLIRRQWAGAKPETTNRKSMLSMLDDEDEDEDDFFESLVAKSKTTTTSTKAGPKSVLANRKLRAVVQDSDDDVDG
jgi:ATP-dependent DNA helicase MPH1